MAPTNGLKGYDSYRVSLGDEMRGMRASLGKSLLDVQRDLRIKANHLDAIENADPSVFRDRGFLAGYVRAYARYLGMDEGEVLRRFNEEAKIVAPEDEGGRGLVARARRVRKPDAAISASRLAAASRNSAVHADIGALARGAGSLATLVALVGGLGYGGWALLQNIQRVEFVPTPDAPAALAEAPRLDGMSRIAKASVAPTPEIDAAALAAVYAAQDAPPPRLDRRDGPIAALDPDASGVYARRSANAASARARAEMERLSRPDPAFQRALELTELAATGSSAPPAQGLGLQTGLSLVFDQEAWVRVRDRSGAVVHQALMQAGQEWRAPDGVDGLTLRAGNAGGVFIRLDGVRYGPLGQPGAVVSSVALDSAAIRATLPKAAASPAVRVETPQTPTMADARP